jgi:hypothetical protein
VERVWGAGSLLSGRFGCLVGGCALSVGFLAGKKSVSLDWTVEGLPSVRIVDGGGRVGAGGGLRVVVVDFPGFLVTGGGPETLSDSGDPSGSGDGVGERSVRSSDVADVAEDSEEWTGEGLSSVNRSVGSNLTVDPTVRSLRCTKKKPEPVSRPVVATLDVCHTKCSW